MAVRTKTRRRLWILLVSFLAISLILGGAYVLRKRQIAQRLVRDRDLGYAALKDGDYFTALHKIGPYVQRNGRDPEALLKYSIARLNVEEPDGKHINNAVQMLRFLLQIQPENQEARKYLLDAYVSMGWVPEILSETQERTDVASLRARAIAMAIKGSDADAIALSYRVNDAAPEDLEMQTFTLVEMFQQKTPADKIEQRATKLQQAHPDDPRFELLMGLAYSLSNKHEQALEWTRKAAARTIEDPLVVHAAVNQLDSLGEMGESLALLQRVAQVRGNPAFNRDLINRLLQGGQYQAVLDRTADVEQQKERADVNLLACRAMALIELRRPDDARRVVGVLAMQKSSAPAVGWASVLDAAVASPIEVKRMLPAAREALRSQSTNPYLHLYYGDALAQLGEGDVAVREWLRARQLAPSWSRPIARIVNVMLTSKMPLDAKELPLLAQIARDDAESLAVVAAAYLSAAGTSPSADALAKILELTDRAQSLRPGEALSLAVKTRALAMAGRLDEARAVIAAAIDPQHTAPAAALIQLAATSELSHLDMEQQCLDRCRAAYGVTPELARALSGRLLRAKGATDALAAFEPLLPAESARSVAWDIDFARLLEVAADPRAAAQWKRVSETYADQPQAQYAVLGSPLAQRDAQLQQNAIKRIEPMMSGDGLIWRLADARWDILSAQSRATDEEKKKDYTNAAKILGEITQAYPTHAQAHLLLSQVFMQLGDKDAAADHLATAVRLAPSALAPPLQLASLLQAMGDFERAKPYLDQAEAILNQQSAAPTSMPSLASGPAQNEKDATAGSALTTRSVIDDAWRTLARLRAAAGETDRAIEILKAHGSDPSAPDMSLASLLSQTGNLTEEVRRQLLAQATPASIGIVAEYLLSTGQTPEAESTIAMLDKLEAPVADRELARAMYLGRKGDLKASAEHLRTACAATPANPQLWQALVYTLLLDGNATDALAAATEASAKLPAADQARFQRITANQNLLKGTIEREAARPVLAMLLNDSDPTSEAISALKALQGELSGALKPEESIKNARAAADQAQSAWPIQAMVIDMYFRRGDFDAAMGLAARATRLHPTDPTPARLATQIAMARGRWEDVISAARDWRERSKVQTLPPDQLLAQAYLATRNPAAAERQLAPYLTQARQDPTHWIPVISLYGQAIFAQGRATEVEALLTPLLPQHEAFRSLLRQFATQPQLDRAVARRWLTQVEAATPKDAVEECVATAAGWVVVANAGKDQEVRQHADQLVRSATAMVTDSKVAKAPVWTALGSVKETAKDLPGAEAAYLEALKLDPNEPIAQNNLAMMILRRDGDLKEAIRLATAASSVEKHPLRADFLDTLACVQEKAGALDAAVVAISSAVGVRSQDPELRVHQVQLLITSKKIPDAREAMRQLNLLMTTISRPDPALLEKIRDLEAQLQRFASSS
jgi:tetratricopeptide (TPR) repeat protein